MKNKAILNDIKEYLISNEETIALAESVTAGYLQVQFSSITDAAIFFQGGLTAYNVGQKCSLLNIEPIYALPVNCVSEKVATAMALNVITLFHSDYGIAITGYAQKDKKMHVTDIFAFFAIAYQSKVLQTGKLRSSKADPEKVKKDYVSQIITAFHKLLKDKRMYI